MVANDYRSVYLRDIEETKTTYTLNYYQIYDQEKEVEIPESGVKGSLNEYGLDVYQNDFENFGVRCGDEYIESYQ